VPARFALVLDDYHLVESKPIHNALAFLLDHQPPQMHLVISTRTDPPLHDSHACAAGGNCSSCARAISVSRWMKRSILPQVMALDLPADEVAAPGDAHRRLDRRPPDGRSCRCRLPRHRVRLCGPLPEATITSLTI